MPVIGKTTNYPDAGNIKIVFVNGIIRYTMPVAYISYVVRQIAGADVSPVQGSAGRPQWGQG